ncbi:hypothetical protein CBM2637_U10013 [Cupriavidus taiwanensis]|nr:hypothetical protein CBM2637_U10013 [Cupriavidus taiwanensis]SPA49615.1 protein of unknown function [Cupriavidus taiwanensis]
MYPTVQAALAHIQEIDEAMFHVWADHEG